MLRSHFAEDEVFTAVDFHFSVGRRTYRIFRQLPHRKGNNKSETGGKAELYELTSGVEVPCIDRFTVSDVNQKAEAVIGLTKEQFSQIVMLPQGEFRKLLTSDTENKEEILRRIFRTGLYQRVEDRFQQQHRELQDALRQAKSTQDIYVKQASETLPVREGSLLSMTLQQEYRSMVQVSDGLAREIEHYEEQAARAELTKAAVASELAGQEAALHAALTLENRFAQLADRKAKLGQHEGKQAEVSESERIVKLAEQASRVEPYEEQAVQAARQFELKRSQHESKLRELAEAERGYAAAEERYRGEEAKDAERKEAERELQRLAELEPIVRTLAERGAEVGRLLAEERECSAKREQAEQALVATREERRGIAERVRQAELETAKRPEVQDQHLFLQNKYSLLRELLELDNKYENYLRKENELEVATNRLVSEHNRLESEWLEGQAGLLAVHLHDGKPCPVCGSGEHPNKAILLPSVPTRETLQAAKDRLRLAEQELSEAKAQAAAASSGREERSKLVADYGISDEPLSGQLLQTELEGKRLKALKIQLGLLADSLGALRQEAEVLDERIEKLQSEREQLMTKQHQLSVERSAKQSLLDNELSRIPETLRTPSELQSRIGEQRRYSESLNTAWLEAQRGLQQKQTLLVEERANAAQLANQAEEAEQLVKQTSLRFEEQLAHSGFADRAAYQGSKLPETERVKLGRLIEEFKSVVASLTVQIAELERELSGQAIPETAMIQATIAESKLLLERVMAELHSMQGYKTEAQRLHAAIEKAVEQFRQLEQKQQQVADIYQMLKGDNSLKISFERYILIEFLEQIIHAANTRLQELSSGQFLLQRSDRLETRGKQSGLGLDVYDSYTGQNRDVKSMSGGEKFNASLCLALGMTDVIQAYQGGVSIEMMFIDEGFGSLDEESLSKAITTLIDLQRSGRTIGVISHVAELKQAFPAILEVSKTKEGHSRTAIILK
jgi:DNA repair protein SbcC/Rad50